MTDADLHALLGGGLHDLVALLNGLAHRLFNEEVGSGGYTLKCHGGVALGGCADVDDIGLLLFKHFGEVGIKIWYAEFGCQRLPLFDIKIDDCDNVCDGL